MCSSCVQAGTSYSGEEGAGGKRWRAKCEGREQEEESEAELKDGGRSV